MTNNLYWTAKGISHNAYDDGHIHKYEAVTGNEIVIDSINDVPLFYYKSKGKTFIVHSKYGVALISGISLDHALNKLNNTIYDFGVGSFIKILNEKIEKLPQVPNVSPTVSGEIEELQLTVSMKTGEPNPNHTNWVKSFKAVYNK